MRGKRLTSPIDIHDDRNEYRRSGLLEENIGKGLENGIRDEEDGQGGVEFARGHWNVLCQVCNFGIANVCPIKEADEVKQAQLERFVSRIK